MRPGDEAFDDAFRRADVRRLSLLVNTDLCPPDVFERLLRHDDAPVRSLGLTLLAEQAARGEASELGALLPLALSAAWPARAAEDALVLAELYARLGPHVPKPYAVAGRVPAWRTAGLPVRVQIVWLRAEIANDPTTVRREPPGEPLYQAVRETSIAGTARLRRLVGELLDSGDPVLVRESLRLAREGLHAGALSAALVRAHLARLLDMDAGGGNVATALAELAEPWAVLEPLPPAQVTAVVGLLTATEAAVRPEAADAALTALARYGHSGALRRAVDDGELPPGLRRRALELLGPLATRDDIGELTAVATRDPLLFGESALACLRGLHRRGHFVTAPDVPAVIALALADHAVAPRDVATILFTCRRDMFRVLTDVPADEPDWPRRLDLLVALAGQGTGETGEVPVGDAVTRALEATSTPRPLLGALRALRYTPAEEAVLACLETEPAAALHTLEAIGGRRTTEALREGLGVIALEGAGVVAPHLRAVRHRALELLWQLTDDTAERRALLVRLDPADLPARIAADLGGPDESELGLLASRVDRAEPEKALCGLAAHGGAGTIPVIAGLLLDVVAELALGEHALSEHDAARRPRGTTAGEAAGGAVVPGEVLEAVRELGRRLHARRRIRPVCLLDAADADAAGDALAATMVLDLLDRPGPTDGERVILLELLTRIPYPHTRPRVHRLLRHRDPHLRKHVIALLAQDTDGDDARTLSASLVTLTAADDIQTVRQALLALGHARARWASGTIAACLDHPNMNIKKTAAGVLAHAGSAVAVPQLLNWLGRHDNPGLRTALVEALRSILGPAYEATVRAALDRAEEPRARKLLSECLAERRPGGAPLSDVAALEAGGWQPAIAARIAGRPELPARHTLRRLRATHADWLELADSLPESMSAVRGRLVRVAVRIAPGRLSHEERRTYARFVRLLLMCLTDKATSGEDGRDVVSVLEELAPTLPTVERRAVAATVRALPGTAPAPTLNLLRGCDAVLVRADLDQALAAAATAREEGAVLREAFGSPDTSRSAPDSRARLAALVDSYPTADPTTRTTLLDRMTALQPLDAPPWTLGETETETETETGADASMTGRRGRTVRADDLDQPRSAALRARLLSLLDAPEPDRRRTAALALLKWPDPGVRRAVLRAHLHGRVDVDIPADAVPTGPLAALLGETEPDGGEIRYERLARLAVRLDPSTLEPLVSLLLERWQRTPEAVRPVLAAVPADTLAVLLGDRLAAGAWGFLDLLAGRTLLRTPELTEIRRRLRAEGRDRVADSLVLVDGPLLDPSAERADRRAWLTERAGASDAPSRQELLHLARTGGPDQIRRALTRLTEDRFDPAAHDDPELRALIGELLHHPRPRVRLHAHRTSRALYDRATYLHHTSSLLSDPQPDVVRSAVRTLAHAGWEPAVPAIVALLDHPHPAVRGAAADGLQHLGPRVIPALRRAADHARPDKRSVYTSLLDRIRATVEEEEGA
ncbi:HEAT repeat domain-containing protein [Streptomyces sp. NPDC058653]|uniref:HEAT repeat domain-containing protein n=1 Tax=Streptomyces sp. NPDC058653 TaxID=3346576 RepID=UPI00364AB5F8